MTNHEMLLATSGRDTGELEMAIYYCKFCSNMLDSDYDPPDEREGDHICPQCLEDSQILLKIMEDIESQ